MFDVELILNLHYILSLLEFVHTLIKYAQGRDVYIFDFVEAIKDMQYLNYMNSTLILNACSKMKFLMHSIALSLENMIGCLWFSLNFPPLMTIGVDTPPNSLKDSNVSPKVKTTKEGIGAHSLTRNTSRVRRVCWSYEIGIRTSDKCVNYSYQFAQTKQQVG
jgi:hypothetical protein